MSAQIVAVSEEWVKAVTVAVATVESDPLPGTIIEVCSLRRVKIQIFNSRVEFDD
jgi:hypothetical protein